jgi:hypothetical protein
MPDIADKIAALMNEMLAADPFATQKLINSRVRCSYELAQHPTIQVGRTDGFTVMYDVGLLGVLNGLCDSKRRVAAVIDDVTQHILRFEARDWPS